jgi:hypothetical protein
MKKFEIKGPFTRAIFHCDLPLLIDVNERINNEFAEYVLPRLNIRGFSTR